MSTRLRRKGEKPCEDLLHFLFSLACTEVAGSSDPFINVLCSLLG